jgi:alkanesulfonate monooxygenase SsuD/methylene tetrahydromethanopterin reductase-like flavin-dependent oxidoreductase (luciferase family)/putative sterol carrier protein
VRFGLFYEHQLPRPWSDGAEEKLLNDALEQIELADRVGLDYVWEVEHHFLEEYSHSSAPEVFLAAASQRTKRIRLGHGIVQLPYGFNHPARIAERVATLDLVSGGRVEFGTGESSSQAELGGFGVDRELKRDQWDEALDVVTRMLVEEPFAGHEGRFLSVPPRNVVPKPKQKPHPPLWVACSRRETIKLAGRKGMGVLAFSFVEPEEAREWVDEYYRLIESEDCVAGGFAVNPNFAVVVPMMCHQDEQTAIDRGIDGGHFFGYSLAHYYVFGDHRPGVTNLYEEFEERRVERGYSRELINAADAPLSIKLLQQGLGSMRGAVGTPAQLTDLLQRYKSAGVDQVIFVAQAGRNQHEHVCESIELFANEVLPAFAETADNEDAARRERYAGACERALGRRSPTRQAPGDYLITPQGEPHPAREYTFSRTAGTPEANGARPPHVPLRARLNRAGEAAFTRLLRSRSDDQLERIVGSAFGMRVIFRGMEQQFDPDRADGFKAEIQYELVGSDNQTRRWVLTIASGKAQTRPGRSESPTVTIRMPLKVFGRMASRELEPAQAFMENRMEIEGDLAAAARLGEVMNRRSYW